MATRRIIISENDRRRLESLLTSNFVEAIGAKPYLADLQSGLQHAVIVASSEMPHDVVTMNSIVRLRDVDSGDVETYTLVFPHQANIAANRLSILAPIGTAILGHRVGDIVRWQVPSGQRCVRIEALLYQPEREGAVHL
jgi:regulator of nucleoside diphosphate kinase